MRLSRCSKNFRVVRASSPNSELSRRYPLDRLRIVPLEAFHDKPERPAHPADEGGVDQKQKHERESEKQEGKAFAPVIQRFDRGHFIANNEVRERLSVPPVQWP